MKKYIAELFGTFVLVFIGCGTVVFSAPYVGYVGIALAFGLAVTAMVYAVGPISGAHLNPAVTFGVLTAGRMSFKNALGYIVAQFVGALAAAALLKYMVAGHIAGYDIAANGLGQNGWGATYGGGYTLTTAIIFEFIATFIFVKVILKVTEGDLKIAGVVIGLTLAVIHILGLPITGVSVNPARSFGPAFFVGGLAIEQLWMFLVVPAIAGIFAGVAARCCCGCCCGSCKIKAEEKEKAKAVPAEASAPRHHAPARRNGGRRPANNRRMAK
ncbi:MAG: aquaporin [Alphaproteobacteria bacterium]|nr:aquaporin [Alphaproteobacteria bacterium]